MKNLALIAALLVAASPAAAQVSTASSEQRSGQSASSQAPTTGVFCDEEMTATFCNVPTAPNTSGYGSSGASGSSAGTAASGGVGSPTPSIPPCGAEPPADELCN
jgi:hypothetical protein